jgi:hypothetical protein
LVGKLVSLLPIYKERGGGLAVKSVVEKDLICHKTFPNLAVRRKVQYYFEFFFGGGGGLFLLKIGAIEIKELNFQTNSICSRML